MLAGERLYLGRYWAFEQSVAARIRGLARYWAGDLDRPLLAAGLTRLFGPADPAAPDWQRIAAAIAVLKPLCVISGGPGTGKTHTVTAILALLLEQARAAGGPAPRIALAAPTGKAAARLTESIRRARERPEIDAALAAAIPDQGQTLHRLLGYRPGRARPRHHAGEPLHLELLVVDEASMVDLPLMARLLDALPAAARLILLGDRDQLASVQSGMVLGDLCGRGREPSYSDELRAALAAVGCPLPATDGQGAAGGIQLGLFDPPAAAAPANGSTGLGDSIALLRRSWRFDPASGIGALAAAVNAGDARAARLVLESGRGDLRHLVLDEAGLRRFLAAELVPRFRDCLAAGDPAAVLDAFNGFRVLCAVRDGPFGVDGINRVVEALLERDGVIRRDGRRHYPGRPLMITSNDYGLGLYNGDIGIVLAAPCADSPEASTGVAGEAPLRAWFETDRDDRGDAGQSDADGPSLRPIIPGRLPAAETVFAMTVHKSQGSEFGDVILVLPPYPSRALTRELVYTGITRARRRVTLITPVERLIDAASQPVERASGLYEALWGGDGAGC
jgi:exodeoxyribonuclease V alpha subunit